MKVKKQHELVESKEAKLQVETTADFDANGNNEPRQQHSAQHQQQPMQTQQQQPAAPIKPDQNAAQAPAVQHHDHDSEPKVSHAQVHDMSHGEPVIIDTICMYIIYVYAYTVPATCRL